MRCIIIASLAPPARTRSCSPSLMHALQHRHCRLLAARAPRPQRRVHSRRLCIRPTTVHVPVLSRSARSIIGYRAPGRPTPHRVALHRLSGPQSSGVATSYRCNGDCTTTERKAAAGAAAAATAMESIMERRTSCGYNLSCGKGSTTGKQLR